MLRSALRSARTLAPSTGERLSGMNSAYFFDCGRRGNFERKRSSQTFERRVTPSRQEHQPARVVLPHQQRRMTMRPATSRLATLGLATALAVTSSLALAQTGGSAGAGSTAGGAATGGSSPGTTTGSSSGAVNSGVSTGAGSAAAGANSAVNPSGNPALNPPGRIMPNGQITPPAG